MSDDELGVNDANEANRTHGGDEPQRSPEGEPFDGASVPDAADAALGLLSPEEAAAMLAAAENDPELARELADFQAVVAELARMAPPSPINKGRSAGIRSRLLTRAAASNAGRPVTRQTGPIETSAMSGASGAGAATAPPSRQTSPRGVPRVTGSQPVRAERPAEQPSERVERRRTPRHWRRTLAWLAAAAVVITAAGVFALWRERNVREPATVAAAPAPSSVGNPLLTTVMYLRAQLAQRDSTIASMMSPHTRVIELASYSPPAPAARVFWDQATQRWTLCVNGLKQPASGRTYQMWIIARGKSQPMSAGTFTPDSAGWAVMTATAPVMPGRLRRVAVTEEPDGGSEYPTGPVLFAGK